MLFLPSLHLFSVKESERSAGGAEKPAVAERLLRASQGLGMDQLSSGCSCSMKFPGSHLLHRFDRSEYVLKHWTESGSSSRACPFVLHAATGWT